MTTTQKVHSQSGLDRILTANAVSSFIGTSFEAHRSDADVRRDAHNQTWLRAVKLTDSEAAALTLFDLALSWAENFTMTSTRPADRVHARIVIDSDGLAKPVRY